MLTNPPFTRQKDTPPLHLRDLDADEMAQWTRMRANYEKLTGAAMPARSPENSTGETLTAKGN